MTLTTIQRIDRIGTDSDLLHHVIHDPAGSVIQTEGGPVRSVSDAVSSITEFTVRGAWATATDYAFKDIYIDGGTAYMVLIAHTSTTIAADLAAGKVGVYQGVTSIDLADPTKGASMVAWRAPLAGSAIRNVADKLAERRTALDVSGLVFGATVSNAVAAANTALMQAYLDNMPSGTFAIEGDLRIGNLVLRNKSNFTLSLVGANINLFGTAAANSKLGIQLDGALTNVDIVGGRILCDGTYANRHAGIFSNSGVVAYKVRALGVYVKNSINGISFNANTSGSFLASSILYCEIDGTIGTASGEGYGAHFADGSGQISGLTVAFCTFRNTTRHAVYHARGIQAQIYCNTFYGHRSGATWWDLANPTAAVADGTIRPALNILRSNDVHAFENRFYEPNGGAILIGKTGSNGQRNKAWENRAYKSAASDTVPCWIIGSQDPTALITDTGDVAVGQPEGAPTGTLMRNNDAELDGNTADMVRIYCAIGAMVMNNTGRRVNVAGSTQAMYDYAMGGDAYNSDHVFDNNAFQMSGSGSTIRLGDTLAGSTFSITCHKNRANAGIKAFANATAVNNPSLTIIDQAINGLGMADGVYPLGRYVVKKSVAYDPVSVPASSGGTLGTATINFSVAGIQKGDQCSVAFDAIGTAIELLTPYVNSNNNVRLILLNLATTPTDLLAGTLDIEVRRNTLDY